MHESVLLKFGEILATLIRTKFHMETIFAEKDWWEIHLK